MYKQDFDLFLNTQKDDTCIFSYDSIMEIIFGENMLEFYQICILFMRLKPFSQKVKTRKNKSINLKSLPK